MGRGLHRADLRLGGLLGLSWYPVPERPARRLVRDLAARGPHPEPAHRLEQRARRDRPHHLRVDAETCGAARDRVRQISASGAIPVRLSAYTERFLPGVGGYVLKSTGWWRVSGVNTEAREPASKPAHV